MKNKIIIFLLLIGGATGCGKFIESTPPSDLTVDSFWKTANDAEVGVLSIYHAFSKAMARGLWYWGEARGDNFTYYERGGLDERELIENRITFENPSALWTTLYDVIGKANAAIKYIPRIEMRVSVRDQLMAEAHAMRAWAYFYCVRVWGDVPLYLEPVEKFTNDIYLTRTDKDYILDNVILPDLEQAYYLVDRSKRTSADRKRINVATICALMMDVHAWKNDYEMVVKTMEERVAILDAGSSSTDQKWLHLVAGGNDWREMFIESPIGEISNEVWFKLDYDRYGNGTHRAIVFFNGSSARFIVTDETIGTYEESDNRRTLQWNSSNRLILKFWPTGTILSGANAVDSDNDLVLYRYADIVLLYAEALCMVGRESDAITELNKTRVRAGNPAHLAFEFLTQDELLEAILAERRKEFLGEGKRWFDLVRTNKWSKYSTLDDARKILFPIHRTHLIENAKLTQNPGYPMP